MLAPYRQSRTLLYRGEEKVGSLPGMGGVNANVESLRKAMYTSQGGTWFSAVFQVFGDGRMKSSFNYDDEPVFTGFDDKPEEVMPALFAVDFDVFPRPPEATPGWLAAKLEVGRVQVAQIEAEAAHRHAEDPEPVGAGRKVSEARVRLATRPSDVSWKLYEAIPDQGADEIRHSVVVVADRAQHRTVLLQGGQEVGAVPTPEGVDEAVRVLRAQDYTVQGGTWFGAVFTAKLSTEFRSSFSYDDEPVFTGPDGEPEEVPPVLYARDFEVFPRPEAATPAWLAAKVAQGRAQIAAEEQA